MKHTNAPREEQEKTDNICAYCGGTFHEQHITYVREYQGSVVIIKHVPAFVCAQCGEKYYTPHTIARLHKALSSGKANATETVPVYEFPQLA